MFNSLRVRLTLLFVTLTIIPLIVVGVLISQRGFEALQNQSIELQSQRAQQVSHELGDFFLIRQAELHALTNVYGLDSLDQTAQYDILSALLVDQPSYYQLALVDASGQEKVRVTRGEVTSPDSLINISSDSLFQTAVESGDVSYSPIHFSDAARDHLITMAIPILDLFTGEIGNILFAEIRFRNIEEQVLRGVNLVQSEDVFVTDSSGVIVAHRNPNLVLQETIFDLPDVNGRHPGLSSPDVILATAPIQLENLEFFVVAETAYADATAFAFDLTNIATIITGITLLVAIVVVTFAVTQIVNPIVRLSRIANAIEEGDFSKRADIRSQDEIGRFASAFNTMTDAIQKREADLEKQADDLRIATARAKEAARVKGEFLANVSHELRTPLNAIIGFSDMLMAGMSGPLNDKQTHKLARLKENGKRLLALINDLLDLTRIESGRLEMVENPFSPRILAERLTAQMESLAVESKLNFNTMVSSDMPETLYGDEKRIEQVVVNLLSNAFKFTKDGSVTLNIKSNPTDHTWNIEVVDTGIGIPPHATNVIFEEFRQVDGSYSRAYKGSGLGLSITRNIVRMMGGKIAVKSVVDVGSTFTVTLPMNMHNTRETLVLESAAS